MVGLWVGLWVGWWVGRLVGWLVGWLVGYSVGWLVGWLVGGWVGGLVGGWIGHLLLLRRCRILHDHGLRHCLDCHCLRHCIGWFRGEPGNSSGAYLVMQNRNLEYGEPRCGFNTKHQRNKGCRSSDAADFVSLSGYQFPIEVRGRGDVSANQAPKHHSTCLDCLRRAWSTGAAHRPCACQMQRAKCQHTV